MKNIFKTRIVSLLLLICLIVTTLTVPVSAKPERRDDRLSRANKTLQEESVHKEKHDDKEKDKEKGIKSNKGQDNKMFHFIDKKDFDKMGHKNRRDDLESLNTYVFDNDDGTRTVYMMKENVKYIDKNGEVREKDITLKREKEEGYTLTESDVELSLPDNPSEGIDVGFSGYTVKIIPQGAEQSIEATLNNNSVIYDGYFGEETSLKYTPLLSGIKEDIILTSYVENAAYDFILETDGLFLYNDDTGYYLADKMKKEASFYLGDIVVYDAIGKPSEGTMNVTAIEEGVKYKLTISANDDFLSDPETVYPVTIDPTITISDSATGNGSIQDAPIFSGYPNKNYGTYLYNRVGTPSSAYGVGRTVVKLTGLINSAEYKALSANQITSVIFYAKEASGSAAQYINLYPLTSNTTWTESTVTWNNVGSYTTAINCGASMSYENVAQFNITNLVKAWKNGTYSANAGFIMMNSTESKNKCFYSAESSTAANCPYVKMTYNTSISLNTTSASVVEGGTYKLTATTSPSGKTVTWRSSNSISATVSSTGVVTAKKAGKATISASYVDADGVTKTASCTVYVYIPNGVYYIQNGQSGLYLNADNGGITNLTNLSQSTKYSSAASIQYQLRQMWKICYLGNGRYSVRPMHKLNMALDVTGTNVDIYSIGTTDTLSVVPDYAEWRIEWCTSGYEFMNNGVATKTMQVQGSSKSVGANVVATSYNPNSNCRWKLSKVASPPSGVYWYDTKEKRAVTGTTAGILTINCGSSTNAEGMGIIPILYSPTSNNQTFKWSSSNVQIANVDSSSGVISAKNAGDVVIVATSLYGGYKLKLNIVAKSLDPFHYHNIQYMRYVRITGKDWWGLGNDTDHTINIVKSTMYDDDYCIIHDNINTGYYREIYINDELKNTLNNLEVGYQEHYNILALLDKSTDQEKAAHSSKGETDQLVEAGHFTKDSSEYYGVWAYNYISSLNLLDYWCGALNKATTAYSVYLMASSFYYSYLMSTSTASMNVASSQYSTTASIIDDIDDALSGMSYSNKTTLSAESRNTILAQENYTNPLPYKAQTPVVKFTQTSSTQYVRVFAEESNKTGRWLMKYSDIQGLTAEQIQSKFALTSKPVYYCYVNVPADTTVFVGVVNQSSVSGTLQYELETFISNTAFGEKILLP